MLMSKKKKNLPIQIPNKIQNFLLLIENSCFLEIIYFFKQIFKKIVEVCAFFSQLKMNSFNFIN
jgi:hypothetical protein